jgi:hypothetical protein
MSEMNWQAVVDSLNQTADELREEVSPDRTLAGIISRKENDNATLAPKR